MTNPLLSAETSRRFAAMRSLLMLAVVCIHAEKGVLFGAGAETPLASAVFTVINRHLFQTAVPLFFAMSGYLLFLRYEGGLAAYKSIAARRFRTLMVPYLACNLFWLAFILIAGGIPGIGGSTYVKTRGYVNLVLGIDGLPLVYPLWFLRDLFTLFLCAPAFHWLLRRMPWLGLAAIWYCWNFVPQQGIPLEFSGAFFFHLGGMLAVRRADLPALDRHAAALLAFYAAVTALSVWIQLEGDPQSLWRFPVWRLSVMTGTAAVWTLTGLLRVGEGQWLTRLAGYIFFIYLLHEPTLSFLAGATPELVKGGGTAAQLGYAAFLAAAAIGATLAAGWGLKRAAPAAYGVLTGGR
jgi:peptidoglycan/LPS O-acetylase OafA/YrhL